VLADGREGAGAVRGTMRDCPLFRTSTVQQNGLIILCKHKTDEPEEDGETKGEGEEDAHRTVEEAPQHGPVGRVE